MFFNKKSNKNGMTYEKTIKLLFAIGNQLIIDLGDESNQNKTLAEYGEEILQKFPDLYKFTKSKKEDN